MKYLGIKIKEAAAANKGGASRKFFLSYIIVALIAFSSCDDETQLQEFTVTFNSNGGTEVSPQTVVQDALVIKPADPTRAGYAFVAWYREAALTTEWNFAADVVTADMTLFAKWVAEGRGDDVYLLTEIIHVDEWGESSIAFEYDNQNRITRIIHSDEWGIGSRTLNYNNAGDLVSITFDDGNVETFNRIGNIITVTWQDESESETLELNAQGFLEKWTSEWGYEDNWHKGVMTFQYQGRNMIEFLSEEEYMEDGEHFFRSETHTFTYDDRKSPFYNCNTPQWVLLLAFIDDYYGIYNNVKTAISEGEWSLMFEYTYNDAGFPTSRTVTERRRRYLNDYIYFYEENVYTETFTYGTASSSLARQSLGMPNVGNSSPRRPFNHRFGSRMENSRNR